MVAPGRHYRDHRGRIQWTSVYIWAKLRVLTTIIARTNLSDWFRFYSVSGSDSGSTWSASLPSPPKAVRLRHLSDADVAQVVESMKQATLASVADLREFHEKYRFFVTGTSASEVEACLGRGYSHSEKGRPSFEHRQCAARLEATMQTALPDAAAAPDAPRFSVEWSWVVSCLAWTVCAGVSDWSQFVPDKEMWGF
ncbi:hypothetical protein PG994_008246 [Apiospora phragmitis]|uniref:Uncharacterized protein n=1 Tax=Apiospora phragmitis TaxID=2905665 RepID=A0ABR1UUZ8_9PEZI